MIPLMMVLFISTLDQTIVATTIPTIGHAFGATSNASWIATAYLLTSAVTTLVFGKLGDMYGRKKIFQFSVVVFLIGSALSGLAPSMVALIGFRALQGVGGGGLNSLVQAIAADLIPARRRAKYIVGSVLAAAGMGALGLATPATPVWLLGVLLVLVGVGLGFFVQVALLAGQNAVDGRELGVATGTLNFAKTLGGAFGAAVFGAILTAQLGGARTVSAIAGGYGTVFFWGVPAMAVAFVLSLLLREKPLSEQMVAVAAGEVDVPEY
jgi:MFS family permease